MRVTLTLSEHELAHLVKAMKEELNIKIHRRLQMLHWKHLGKTNTEIAKLLSVRSETITGWLNIYRSKWLAGLQGLDYTGRRPSKLDSIKEQIIAYIEKENVATLSVLQDWIKKTFDLDIEQSWLYRYCKKNSIFLTRRQNLSPESIKPKKSNEKQ